MAFTAQELNNIANAVLDYHIRGPVESQVLQDRPLYNDLMSGKRTFPGGKEFITGRVKGVYSSQLQGYTHDDDVGFLNPANIREWRAKWYELSAGLAVTHTELKHAGIHVMEGAIADRPKPASDIEVIQLTNLLDDKMEDLKEGSYRSMAEMLWRDGTQDSKAIPGVLSFIFDAPATGVTFSIDRAANSWWRNRAVVGINAGTPANQNIVTTLQREMRQLRRFAAPKHKCYAGSDFLEAMEREIREKGNYTLDGWAKSGRIDASMADLAFKGVDFVYEPLLDDIGRAKYAYMLDLKAIRLMAMQDEEWKMHNPERPPTKYVMYRALTYTGALCASRLNSSGVYSIL
jgi:hypothetical protein